MQCQHITVAYQQTWRAGMPKSVQESLNFNNISQDTLEASEGAITWIKMLNNKFVKCAGLQL